MDINITFTLTDEQVKAIIDALKGEPKSTLAALAGIGSYNYQYQTRDTFGFAMKATNVVIDGVEKAIYKDPKTDSGTKRSLKGRIAVVMSQGSLVAVDNIGSLPFDNVFIEEDLLTTVWKDGKFIKYLGFDEVRRNTGLVA